jgi:hypothetical protein
MLSRNLDKGQKKRNVTFAILIKKQIARNVGAVVTCMLIVCYPIFPTSLSFILFIFFQSRIFGILGFLSEKFGLYNMETADACFLGAV